MRRACARLLDQLAAQPDGRWPQARLGWPARRAPGADPRHGPQRRGPPSVASQLVRPSMASHRSGWSSKNPEVSLGLECLLWKHVRRHGRETVSGGRRSATPPRLRDRNCFDVLLAEGYKAHARCWATSQEHISVSCRMESWSPYRRSSLPVPEGQAPADALLEVIRRHEQSSRPAEAIAKSDNPFRWRPTVSLHAIDGWITDLQSGAVCRPGGDALMASLPLPPELRDLVEIQGE